MLYTTRAKSSAITGLRSLSKPRRFSPLHLRPACTACTKQCASQRLKMLSGTNRPLYPTSKMATMKALVYGGVGKPVLKDVQKPKIVKSTDAVVKMLKTTVCGTDLHILKGDVPTCDIDRVLGHEGIGVVEFIGDGVKNFKSGDRVILSCVTICGSCASCRKGLHAHCADGGWILGHKIDGTHAEYVRVPHADASLHRMVQGASDSVQVLMSDVLITGHEMGVLNGRVTPGSTVAVVGSGPIGLAALLTSQLYSPSMVIMIDLDANRLETARSLGATHTVLSGENTVPEVLSITNGRGVDAAIEAVGIPATFELCQEIIAPGGTIANIGVHGSKADIHLEKLWGRNIAITMGSVNGTTATTLLEHLDSRRIEADKLVTGEFRFSDIEAAYSTFTEAAKHNALKVIINFD